MTKHIYLSVVIPSYNEATNIRLGALDKVFHYLDGQEYVWEVIIVDDGSSDDSPKLIDEFVKQSKNFSVIHNPHMGKAGTVVTGMLAAKGDIALFTDLDQATPINQAKKILPWFSEGYDVVIGSRNTQREGAPVFRLIMARGFMFLRSAILGLKGITDTQCGFKAFKREVAHAIFTKLKLYGSRKKESGSAVSAGFDIETLYIAKTLGYKIKEVPVEWHYVETRRVNPIIDSWKGFLDILTIRINDWKGLYL